MKEKSSDYKKLCTQTDHLNFSIKKEMKPLAVSRKESHNDHKL